ncbi:methyltransferase domain-containing protein [Erythrobacter aquimaris]|uniref:Methyltransferase domain-containing protein n=1 Tax=Qipengyuania aquimaris TaxID=255984 RepID=A0A6I4TFL9_9SPHN|nr:protein-glutamate O-methyltransferase CheR [Qipengyuania aquimaris]MXO94892.1 methyltransferase domain-containing protein [Qipengyuania aquimaris]
MAIDDASHRIIADLLASRTGQQLTENRRWRVSTALSGLFREIGIENVDQLACMLERPGEYRLATRVVEALLNNETYFFRDHVYFNTLANTVLPELAEKRASSRKLTIWSAGCSTGQEVLSLAMLFAEQAGRWQDWTIEIVGTDISGKAIEQAQSGVYSQFEIQRGISVAQMLNFFSEAQGGWKVCDKIKAMTRFERQNILDFPPKPGRFDLVLCRNVLLYFAPETRRSAFDKLASGLASDGLLMLGAGETVVGQTDRFEPSGHGSALYCPKIGQATARKSIESILRPAAATG